MWIRCIRHILYSFIGRTLNVCSPYFIIWLKINRKKKFINFYDIFIKEGCVKKFGLLNNNTHLMTLMMLSVVVYVMFSNVFDKKAKWHCQIATHFFLLTLLLFFFFFFVWLMCLSTNCRAFFFFTIRNFWATDKILKEKNKFFVLVTCFENKETKIIIIIIIMNNFI